MSVFILCDKALQKWARGGQGAAVPHPRRTNIAAHALIRLRLAIVCPMGRGSVTLAGC